MDALDYAIYQHLSPDGLARFWASRRLTDPRVTAREIAGKVGLSEAGVRSRLRRLRENGLLQGSEVGLNPSLFGATTMMLEVPVRSPQESDRVFHDLPLVDGVLFARDILDEEDRKVQVYYVSDTLPATARRTSLLRRLAPGGTARGPTPYWIPTCLRVPTPLDWRLLAAFRRDPDATVARFASSAGLSLKTTSRRFDLLVDARACWWSPNRDSQEWPLALLYLSLRPDAEVSSVAAEVARSVGRWISVAPDGLGIDPGVQGPPLAGLVPADRPAALEIILRRILDVDGILAVRRTFGLRSATYPQWADGQLSVKVPPSAARR